jgi:hypothetical protein
LERVGRIKGPFPSYEICVRPSPIHTIIVKINSFLFHFCKVCLIGLNTHFEPHFVLLQKLFQEASNVAAQGSSSLSKLYKLPGFLTENVDDVVKVVHYGGGNWADILSGLGFFPDGNNSHIAPIEIKGINKVSHPYRIGESLQIGGKVIPIEGSSSNRFVVIGDMGSSSGTTVIGNASGIIISAGNLDENGFLNGSWGYTPLTAGLIQSYTGSANVKITGSEGEQDQFVVPIVRPAVPTIAGNKSGNTEVQRLTVLNILQSNLINVLSFLLRASPIISNNKTLVAAETLRNKLLLGQLNVDFILPHLENLMNLSLSEQLQIVLKSFVSVVEPDFGVQLQYLVLYLEKPKVAGLLLTHQIPNLTGGIDRRWALPWIVARPSYNPADAKSFMKKVLGQLLIQTSKSSDKLTIKYNVYLILTIVPLDLELRTAKQIRNLASILYALNDSVWEDVAHRLPNTPLTSVYAGLKAFLKLVVSIPGVPRQVVVAIENLIPAIPDMTAVTTAPADVKAPASLPPQHENSHLAQPQSEDPPKSQHESQHLPEPPLLQNPSHKLDPQPHYHPQYPSQLNSEPQHQSQSQTNYSSQQQSESQKSLQHRPERQPESQHRPQQQHLPQHQPESQNQSQPRHPQQTEQYEPQSEHIYLPRHSQQPAAEHVSEAQHTKEQQPEPHYQLNPQYQPRPSHLQYTTEKSEHQQLAQYPSQPQIPAHQLEPKHQHATQPDAQHQPQYQPPQQYETQKPPQLQQLSEPQQPSQPQHEHQHSPQEPKSQHQQPPDKPETQHKPKSQHATESKFQLQSQHSPNETETERQLKSQSYSQYPQPEPQQLPHYQPQYTTHQPEPQDATQPELLYRPKSQYQSEFQSQYPPQQPDTQQPHELQTQPQYPIYQNEPQLEHQYQLQHQSQPQPQNLQQQPGRHEPYHHHPQSQLQHPTYQLVLQDVIQAEPQHEILYQTSFVGPASMIIPAFPASGILDAPSKSDLQNPSELLPSCSGYKGCASIDKIRYLFSKQSVMDFILKLDINVSRYTNKASLLLHILQQILSQVQLKTDEVTAIQHYINYLTTELNLRTVEWPRISRLSTDVTDILPLCTNNSLYCIILKQISTILYSPLIYRFVQDNAFNSAVYWTKEAYLKFILQNLVSRNILSAKDVAYVESYLQYVERQQPSIAVSGDTLSDILKYLIKPSDAQEQQMSAILTSWLSKANFTEILGDYKIDLSMYAEQLLKSILRYALNHPQVTQNQQLRQTVLHFISRISPSSVAINMGHFVVPLGVQITRRADAVAQNKETWSPVICKKTINLKAVLRAVDRDRLGESGERQLTEYFEREFNPDILIQGFQFWKYNTKGTWLKELLNYILNETEVSPSSRALLSRVIPLIHTTGVGGETLEYVS